ncbi:MAG: N-formylglutamate amidohydrolase, partial [Sphingomonadales bacterium]
MTPYSLQRGVSPLLVSIPHAGTELPEDMKSRLTAAAAPLPDTDWHVEKLYDFAPNLDATLLVA